MRTCLVLWCGTKGNIPGIHFFHLTRARHDIWMRALGRDPTVEHLSEKNVVCSKHFSPEDSYTTGGKMFLKPNAVPRLLLRQVETSAQERQEERTLHEVTNYGNTCQNENLSQQIISVEEDDDNVLFIEEKENAGVGIRVSCTTTVEFGESSPVSISTSSTDSPRSLKRPHQDTSSDSEGNKGQLKRMRKDIKIQHNYSVSPSNLLHKLKHAHVKKMLAQKKVKTMKIKVNRLQKRVTSLKQIIWTLKKKYLISENGLEILEKSNTSVPLSLMKRVVEMKKKKLQGKQVKHEFNNDLRKFAMTLQFLSSKAYTYVRNVFGLALPAPSTIRRWLSKVNCEPGFCENSFNSLKLLVAENKEKNKDTLCSLMLDEMAIKKQIEVRNLKTWGYEDFGTGVDGDSLKYATEALVLMIVSLDGSWKLPIAYFFINSMTGSEKANIVMEALRKLNEVGVKIVSVTCDGPSANITMAEKLGGNIRRLDELKCHFTNPSNDDNIFLILDACHMLKLVRNNWASCGVFINEKGEKIDFNLIIKLHNVQEQEFCNLANKIGKRHIDWRSQKMKVNLAAQTLSSSVASALEFLMKDMQHPDFKEAAPTIQFIRIIDRIFDLLNSRNPFAKGYKAALRTSNQSFWRPIFEETFTYLKSLRLLDGTLLYNSKHKTPILGFCTTIKSVLGIFDEYVEGQNSTLTYLLTYKFSQDHLELFFCGIRGRNGWNNNPTAFQFYYTFRRLCMKIDLKVLKGNCEIMDDTNMLDSVHANGNQNPMELCLDDISIIKKYDIDSNDIFLEDDRFLIEINVLPSLSLLTENVVTHISGFVVKSVRKFIKCAVCLDSLEEADYNTIDTKVFKLLYRKDRGGLVKPSKDVIRICEYTEKKIRQVLNITDNMMPTEKKFLETCILQASSFLFQERKVFSCLENHMFDISPYGINHTMRLIKLIVRVYSKIRFFKIAKRQTEIITGEMKRRKLTKLILFSHQ